MKKGVYLILHISTISLIDLEKMLHANKKDGKKIK